MDEEEVEVLPEDELRVCWNDLIKLLLETKEVWEKFRELLLDGGMGVAERSGFMLNKYASMFGKSEFLVAIPGLLNHCRSYRGSLDELLMEEEKEDD